MPDFLSRPCESTRRRRSSGSPWSVESLEGRTLLSVAGGQASSTGADMGSAHLNVPTQILLVSSNATAESAQTIRLTAKVENANRDVKVSQGSVRFVLDSPTHEVLATKKLDKLGESGITITTFKQPGTYQVNAIYVPSSSQFTASASIPATVSVSPLTATSFKVVPVSRAGRLNHPVSFTVTALEHGQPDPDYTGEIAFSSPTDNFTVFPKEFYENLSISASPPPTTGLALFPNKTYTFTPADHGTHTFIAGAIFKKGGAEILKVHQANDGEVYGETTFAIG